MDFETTDLSFEESSFDLNDSFDTAESIDEVAEPECEAILDCEYLKDNVESDQCYIASVEEGLKDSIETYTSNGYEYALDDEGRIARAGGDLRLEDGERNSKAQLEAGGEFRRDSDDGGHLIATRFGGSGDLDNLIAENSNVNRSGFKSLENEWARELANGNDVHVELSPIYQEGVERPHVLMGEYEVKDAGKSKGLEYFSFTNENLNSEEFAMPEEMDEMLNDFEDSNS